MSSNNEQWGTRVGLILAMAGNAVGLGNFLRFPIQAVQNGGGSFIIPYLVCLLIMGIPLLWIEWTMGRFGGKYGNHSTPFILDNFSKKRFWKYIGVFGIFTNIGVAAFYCYIESWTLSYVFHSVFGTFSGMNQAEVAAFFGTYVNISESTSLIPYEAVVMYLVCLLLNTWILSKGLKDGVEKVARFGVPMLLVFGAMLAIRGLTLGDSAAPEGCTDCDARLGMDFLWSPPTFTSLMDFKVWLAAAGQIFFTLSVGMGTIHCYAAYVRTKDDIALNAMSAGWMNTFVEVVLGASIIVPIAAGYLGLGWVQENASFAMAFQTMPYLFDQWGAILGAVAGMFWFGLLFFAGITSSLAMGTPWMGFMEDEFDWKRKPAAWSFGGMVLLMGLPTVFFFHEGVFDEYDYWAGTVSLVVFALFETFLFAWVFGINKGWDELNRGSDIQIPIVFRFIMKWVTPFLLLIVFLGALVTPVNNDWARAFSGDWELDPGSIIGKIANKGTVANRDWFADHFESEAAGKVHKISTNPKNGKHTIDIASDVTYYRLGTNVRKNGPNRPEGAATFDSLTVVASYNLKEHNQVVVQVGDQVAVGQKLADGSRINNGFYTSMARLLLMSLFGFICIMVRVAYLKRKREGRLNP